MFGEVIVPLDGSELAASALDPAQKTAAALGWPLQVVCFVDADERKLTMPEIGRQVDRIVKDETPAVEVYSEPLAGPVGEEIVDWATRPGRRPGALICMATHGRGHSAAILGSVTTGVLRHRAGPTLLVGPAYDAAHFSVSSPVVVALDGLPDAEQIVPAAKTWAIAFGCDVEFVQAMDPADVEKVGALAPRERGIEANYLHRMVTETRADLPFDTSFELLGDSHPAEAIVRRADALRAGVIAIATHGARGTKRLLTGSVMADIVRTSRSPVLTQLVRT